MDGRFEIDILAEGGAGKARNNSASAMAYFKGHLYVGTTNSSRRGAAHILRFHPEERWWETVYTPPMVDADERINARHFGQNEDGVLDRGRGRNRRRPANGKLPRDYGYRSMAVFKGRSDRTPALYIGSRSLWGGVIIRSEDGETFETVSEPGFGDDSILSFRGLQPYRGRLFTAPAGTITSQCLDPNRAPEATVFASDDPASGRWALASEIGFGDAENTTIYSLAVAHGRLYAGTQNIPRAFQVWVTEAKGRPPFKWRRVIRDGAYRYSLNQAAATMVGFGDALYVGSGLPGFGYDTVNDVGPAAAELIRIHRDGSWDLIFGEPRLSPDGLKIPLAAMGPGLDDFYNSVVWSMTVHDGALYLGTHNCQPFDSLRTPGRLPRTGALKGGFQLWSTRDGEHWRCLISDGNGSPGAIGVRSLLSMPDGLVAGTSSHVHLLRILGSARGGQFNLEEKEGFSVLRLSQPTSDGAPSNVAPFS